MGVTCNSIRAGALALVALAWLGGPAAAEATAAAPNAETASAPPAAAAPAETSPAAAPAPAPTPAATPQDAAAPAVDPQMAAALSAALDALVAADVKASPIGAGDWRAARLAIRSFYAARGFAPVWTRRATASPRRAGPRSPVSNAPTRTRSISPPSPCRRICRPTRPRSGSPKPRRRCRRPWSLTRCRRAGRASSRPASLRSSPPARPSPIPARRWPRSPPPRTPTPRSKATIPSRRAIATCATSCRGRARPRRRPRPRPRRRRRRAFPTDRASALACTTRACRWCARASAFPPTGRPPKSTTFPSPWRCKPSSAPTACRPTARLTPGTAAALSGGVAAPP